MDPLEECLTEVPQGDGVGWPCRGHQAAGVSLWRDSFGEEDDITLLMEEIRKSVIGDLNKLSQRVELSNMGQHDGESVRENAARLHGKSDWCGLTIECSRAGCDQKTS